VIEMLKRMGAAAGLFLGLASVSHADPAPAAIPPFHAMGRVVAADGKPATGATVTIVAIDISSLQLVAARQVRADAGGTFDASLDGLPPRVRYGVIYASSPDGVAVAESVLESGSPVTIALQPVGSLTVHAIDAAGQPVVGARLTVDEFAGPNHQYSRWIPTVTPQWSVVTDDSGQASFARLPCSDRVHLDTTDLRYAHVADATWFNVGGASNTPDAVLTLHPAQTISGTATYGASGPPVPGCRVAAQPAIGGFAFTAPTDRDGHFRFEQLAPGQYNLDADSVSQGSSRWLAGLRTVTMPDGKNLPGQDIVLVRGGTLRGRVTDPTTGKPAANVAVYAVMPNEPSHGPVLTDAGGRYSMCLIPGTYYVTASCPIGAVQAPSVQVAVAVDGTCVQDFRTSAPQDVIGAHGIVVAPNGQPASGAQVWLFSPATLPPVIATTDASGRFSFGSAPATAQFLLCARLGDLGTATPAPPVDGQDTVLNLSRVGAHSVRAIVTDSQGQPIANAKVRLALVPAVGFVFDVGVGSTDADGRYTFEPAFAETDYDVTAVAPKYLHQTTASFTIDPSTTVTDAPRIALVRANGFVAGTVIDPAGAPVAGATVLYTAQSDDPTSPPSVTDASGRFRIVGVPSGDVYLSVTAPGARNAAVMAETGVDTNVIRVSTAAEKLAARKRFRAMVVADKTSHGDGRDAHVILAEDEQRAAATHRKLFVVFHASWCHPCYLLHNFLNDPRARSVMDAHFVVQELDLWEAADDKSWENPGADAIYRHYSGGENEGVPYYVVLDTHGRMIGDSKRNGQNMGMPEEPAEIDCFVATLKRADPRLSTAETAVLEEGIARILKL
jgi:thioredoxin-related protein